MICMPEAHLTRRQMIRSVSTFPFLISHYHYAFTFSQDGTEPRPSSLSTASTSRLTSARSILPRSGARELWAAPSAPRAGIRARATPQGSRCRQSALPEPRNDSQLNSGGESRARRSGWAGGTARTIKHAQTASPHGPPIQMLHRYANTVSSVVLSTCSKLEALHFEWNYILKSFRIVLEIFWCSLMIAC
jgi:hypothetical protein